MPPTLIIHSARHVLSDVPLAPLLRPVLLAGLLIGSTQELVPLVVLTASLVLLPPVQLVRPRADLSLGLATSAQIHQNKGLQDVRHVHLMEFVWSVLPVQQVTISILPQKHVFPAGLPFPIQSSAIPRQSNNVLTIIQPL